jgi:hypothetical protein
MYIHVYVYIYRANNGGCGGSGSSCSAVSAALHSYSSQAHPPRHKTVKYTLECQGERRLFELPKPKKTFLILTYLSICVYKYIASKRLLLGALRWLLSKGLDRDGCYPKAYLSIYIHCGVEAMNTVAVPSLSCSHSLYLSLCTYNKYTICLYIYIYIYILSVSIYLSTHTNTQTHTRVYIHTYAFPQVQARRLYEYILLY